MLILPRQVIPKLSCVDHRLESEGRWCGLCVGLTSVSVFEDNGAFSLLSSRHLLTYGELSNVFILMVTYSMYWTYLYVCYRDSNTLLCIQS